MIRLLANVAIRILSGIKFGASFKDKFMLLVFILSSIFILSVAIIPLGTERAIERLHYSKPLGWVKEKTVMIKRNDILVEIPLILDYINVIKPQYLAREIDYIQKLQLGNGNQVFLDIGANVGLFSFLLAKAHPKANVIAVEASFQVFDRLERNLKLNSLGSRVKILHRAVTDRDDTSEELYENDSRSTTLSHLISNTRKSRPNQNISTVQTVTIDSLVSEYRITEITLIKIDIEGAEARAILGARKSLEEHKIRNLIIEYHSLENRDFLNQYLKKNGYTLLVSDTPQPRDGSVGHVLATATS